MLKLIPSIHPLLNEYVIKLLGAHKIVTVSDFLQADPNKLLQITKLNLYDLDIMKCYLSKHIGIDPIDGRTYYQQLMNNSKYLLTGIKNLDELLNGGLIAGNMVDICGLSAAGKTQLYTTIAVNLAEHQNIETFVIDTKGDFSGQRMYWMLQRRAYDESKIEQIMKCVKIEKCSEPLELISLIEKLIDNVKLYPKFKVLVIDSLPALWYLYHDDIARGQSNLAILANLLRKLAVKHTIVILTVNLASNWIANWSDNQRGTEAFKRSNNGNATSNASTSKSTTTTTTTTTAISTSRTSIELIPALGKYWRSRCSLRLLITRLKATKLDSDNNSIASTSTSTTITNSNQNQRIVSIIKSNHLKTNSFCMVTLTDVGVH